MISDLNNRFTTTILMAIFLATAFVFGNIKSASADVQNEIDQKNQQIQQIQQQIDQYQNQIDSLSTQSKTLENEIASLNAKINSAQLEIQSLQLSISQTNLEIGQTQGQINDAEDQITKHKNALAQYLKIIYQNDQTTLTVILLKNGSVSDFFNDLNNVQITEENLQTTITNIQSLKTNLETQEADLENKKNDLQQLQGLQVIEKRGLDQTKAEKNNLLQATKGQESKYQQMITSSQQNIKNIQEQIYYLQQNGVSVDDAIKYGQLAAIATGIRPAFLIAILEIESGLGKNVGTGNWLDDMYNCYKRLGKPSRAEAEKAAFFEIVNELGLDPNTVKVSAEPNYGCGGALGPAQFLPSTWLGYKDRVAQLTGHNPPNPWNIEDAFMASAVKLANGGATSQNRTGETRAAKAYISGSPTCTSSICNYYANAVLRTADEIAQNL